MAPQSSPHMLILVIFNGHIISGRALLSLFLGSFLPFVPCGFPFPHGNGPLAPTTFE